MPLIGTGDMIWLSKSKTFFLIDINMELFHNHIGLSNNVILGKYMYIKFAKLLPIAEIQPALPESDMD